MQATLNIEGLAYCSIDIEGSSVPPSMNMLSSILIMEGFGMGLPVLQLILNDEKESLSKELAIADGSRIVIRMGRDTKNIKECPFRVFGWRRSRSTSGPRLEIVGLLDVPEFGAGAFCEAFRVSSSDLMAQIASLCGLTYDGPAQNTDDLMTWLNLNTTRLSFTEDVAMRGYTSEQSCMARIVTMDKTLRYKNLFDVLSDKPKFTFVHDTTGAGTEGVVVSVRESRDASVSGMGAHHVNYGQKHYQHEGNGIDEEILTLTAPLLGTGLPLNDDVLQKLKERGSRVSYSGFDPGTAPTADDAVHQFYENAYYQNLRFLSLFSERLVLLNDQCTDSKSFDPVAYLLKNDKQNGTPTVSADVSSQYVLGGKSILIKNGLRFAEAHYLYRPFLSTPAKKGQDSGQAPVAQNASASSSGPIAAAATQTNANTATNLSSQLVAGEGGGIPVPATTAAMDSMKSLDAFNSAFPAVPSIATNLAPNAQMRSAMDGVRSSTAALDNIGGPLGASIKAANVIPADTSYFQRVTAFGGDMLSNLTDGFNINRIASDIDYARSNSTSFKAAAIGRVSGAFGDVTGFRVNNIVSAATGGRLNKGAIVGEVLGGGIWAADLATGGMGAGQLDLPFTLPFVDTAAGKVTTNFLMDTTGFGIGPDNITINPHKTARAVNAFANSTNPQQLLLTQGADSYIKTFGNVTPTDAASSLQELSVISAKVMSQYGQNEYLSDDARTNKALIYAGRETIFSFGGKGATPLLNSVEKVYDYGGYQNVETTKQATTWARLYSMGKDVTNKAGQWEAPVFPSLATETDTTAGLSNSYSSNATRYFGG
jgi:hypothetical protein